MNTVAARVKHEFMEMLPPTLFFLVILHVVALVRALLTRDTGISLPTAGAVTLAALVLGKSVLIANLLPFVNRFPEKPLIWNVGWKTLIYTLVATLFHFLERLYDYWKDTHHLGAANRQLLAEVNWPHFIGIEILLVVLILNYCTLAELARVIGRRRFAALFLGPMPALPPENEPA
ncbi:hypothetical protein [Paraburkholderia acidisoli]|uniref:Uncharacterized protein n=1 Tax=Paraburkholderia acidisoli TaxID=2571748 RepID=A0A7Z2GJZ3_9BURK|nr:hypothetical protein [Paraburkholderia acidisoli]QGZ63116.1 hypothetical protein FAZ98_14980 [Paraburkholderia acidisoli]